MLKNIPGFALLCLVSVGVAGCGSNAVDARVPLKKGQRILVVPFAQGKAKCFESRLGRDLAGGISATLIPFLPKEAGVLDQGSAEALLPVPRTDSMDWGRLGKALKADWVVVGVIRDYRLRDPGTLTTRRGTMVVDYRILDVARGMVALEMPGRAFHFPLDRSDDPAVNYGMDVFTGSEEDIATGLMEVSAFGIASEFFDHELPK